MHCPKCQGDMARQGRFFFCGDCGCSVPAAEAEVAAETQAAGRTEFLEALPGVVAIPLHEYDGERHPVMRLHRLCDAMEIVARFCVIVLLAELRRGLGGAALPEDLLRELQPRIELPTFGKCRDMLEALVKACRGLGDPVVPPLSGFVSGPLLGMMPRGEASAEASVLAMRNDLVHGGAMSRAAAERHLACWAPRLDVKRQLFLTSRCLSAKCYHPAQGVPDKFGDGLGQR